VLTCVLPVIVVDAYVCIALKCATASGIKRERREREGGGREGDDIGLHIMA
jgi:hypothetical protein